MEEKQMRRIAKQRAKAIANHGTEVEVVGLVKWLSEWQQLLPRLTTWVLCTRFSWQGESTTPPYHTSWHVSPTKHRQKNTCVYLFLSWGCWELSWTQGGTVETLKAFAKWIIWGTYLLANLYNEMPWSDVAWIIEGDLCLRVLKTGSSKPRCHQGWFLLMVERRTCSRSVDFHPGFQWVGGSFGFPELIEALPKPFVLGQGCTRDTPRASAETTLFSS